MEGSEEHVIQLARLLSSESKRQLVAELLTEFASELVDEQDLEISVRIRPRKGSVTVAGVHGGLAPLSKLPPVTGRKPTAFKLFGDAKTVRKWKDVLVGVCNQLASRYPKDFRRIRGIHGRNRKYFSHDTNELHTACRIESTDIYVDTTFSAVDVVKICGSALELFGHQPDELEIALFRTASSSHHT